MRRGGSNVEGLLRNARRVTGHQLMFSPDVYLRTHHPAGAEYSGRFSALHVAVFDEVDSAVREVR